MSEPSRTLLTPSPYGSAKDLPTFQEMARMVQGGKLLTLFIARGQRQQLVEIEQRMERLARVADAFYDRLGPRNWIFHDLLPIDAIERLLAESADADAAEQRLIEIYRDSEATRWWLPPLQAIDGLRERMHQVQRAREHYDADQFDSCVLQLIAVMDGFVNDFDPATRKGLTSRDPEDMTAWDSVVGHHMGLTHAMTTFKKTVKRRVDGEVFEVYRHGIMHGSVVRFDNVVVATKAWNMLFAVIDWARARRKAAEPSEPNPSWRETWAALKRHADWQRYEKQFRPQTVSAPDPEFDSDPVVARAREFLDAWQHRRWGIVAQFAPPMLARGNSDGETIQFTKDVFEGHELTSCAIVEVDHGQASGAEVRGTATVNGAARKMRFRMVLWDAEGNVGLPTDREATWCLGIWAPHAFFAESDAAQ